MIPCRSCSRKLCAEVAGKGYDSKKTYYYGLKPHTPAFRRNRQPPPPDYIGITPAGEADINVLKDIADDLCDIPVYADKAQDKAQDNISGELKRLLAGKDSPMNTPVKKFQHLGMSEEIRPISVSRPIESLLGWIEEKTGIQTASKARSTRGLPVHVYSRGYADTKLQLLIRIIKGCFVKCGG